MTHTKGCKFCGVPVTVESDADCPMSWVDSLLGMLSCNRCADYRAGMSRIGAAIRKVCLNYIQLINSKTSTEDAAHKARKLLEGLTWKVADATCRFYRIKTIYSHDFVDQIMEKPDKSAIILRTYAGLVRDEAKRQRQQHEQRINPETVLHGSGGEAQDQAQHGLQPDGERTLAMAGTKTSQSEGGAGSGPGGGLPEQAVLI